MQQASRTVNTARNIVWGYLGNILTMLLSFVSRTVFIYAIGTTYLGVNGLFTNVLGVLSFTELGIGTAMNFSLYKPVAKGDTEKIKSLMHLYKYAYRVIAFLVTALGLILLPFLPYIVKGGEGIDHIPLYYLIFLFNTVTSYFITYKYGLVNAEQKGYILTNIDSIFRLLITILQIVALILFHDFLIYLLVQAVVSLVQKIITSIYLNRQYPYLSDKHVISLEECEKKELKTNIKALMIHKIGEISIYQTDNIIISAFLNITLVGLVSNYNLLLTTVSAFLTIVLNGITTSCGNLIATENKEKQLQIYKVYNFIGFWLYGFTTICFFILFQPFITLWIGADKLIDNFSVCLILLNNYLMGQRTTINNFKTAGGIFSQDKYASLIQAGINLVLSIVLVNKIGLPGIYIGTVLSGMVPLIWKPIVTYKNLFKISSIGYFKDFSKYFLTTVVTSCILYVISVYIFASVTVFHFIVMLFITLLMPNLVFWLFYRNSEEFKFLYQKIVFLKKGRKQQ